MAFFADIQYCNLADLTPLVSGLVGGSVKAQNYADVIYEWSHMKHYRSLLSVRFDYKPG